MQHNFDSFQDFQIKTKKSITTVTACQFLFMIATYKLVINYQPSPLLDWKKKRTELLINLLELIDGIMVTDLKNYIVINQFLVEGFDPRDS